MSKPSDGDEPCLTDAELDHRARNLTDADLMQLASSDGQTKDRLLFYRPFLVRQSMATELLRLRRIKQITFEYLADGDLLKFEDALENFEV